MPPQARGHFWAGDGYSAQISATRFLPLVVDLEHLDNIEHHHLFILDMQVAGHGGAKLDNIHQFLFCTNIGEPGCKDDVFSPRHGPSHQNPSPVHASDSHGARATLLAVSPS